MLGSFLKKLFASFEAAGAEKRRRAELEEQECRRLIDELLGQCDALSSLINDSERYFGIHAVQRYSAVRQTLAESRRRMPWRIQKRFRTDTDALDKRLGELIGQRESHNRAFIANMKTVHASLFASVEGHPLDDQQTECIVREDDNLLVIAGAGSGKTTTIVGKVKYLLSTGSCSPEDILLLSFTNASAADMARRVKSETGQTLDVMTFHKLGLSIIAEAEGKKPRVTELDPTDFIRASLDELVRGDAYLRSLVDYFVSHIREYRDPFSFSSAQECEDPEEDELHTLKKEKVKSHEELEIANFLFLNGINYEYERPYAVDTATVEHSQYRPDFYLPDYGIYIEHFAIRRNGDVPSFFSGTDGKSARDTYNDGIRWKRKTHAEHGTKLVETYSYEKFEGCLSDNLKRKLEAEGVSFNAVTPDTVLQTLRKNAPDEMGGLIELMVTFLNLTKASNLSPEELLKRNGSLPPGPRRFRNAAFLALFVPIYERYSRELQERREVDFSDMINRATEYVTAGRSKRQYRQIIIDEYQDISRARYSLVKALRDQSNAKLMCVGDDWQSIYRFAGSDVGFFVYFHEYWGPTQRCLIETTYRFGSSLISVSSQFIQKNPSQVAKNLRSIRAEADLQFDVISSSSESYAALDLVSKLRQLPKDSSVLLLGRYGADIRPFLRSALAQIGRDFEIGCPDRPDLRIKFLTIHRSKGLQADYVFILNNKKRKPGFPSRILDDAILGLVLEKKEDYPFAEERRLFYVALTRARRFAWLVTIKGNESTFAAEVEREWGQYLKREHYRCPGCGEGRLIRRKGPYGEFWGCSRYPVCTYKTKEAPGRVFSGTGAAMQGRRD